MEFKISSDSIGAISLALAKAQATIENAVKDSNNPFFKSKYADLAAVRNSCKKPLSENGLAVSGSVICENGIWIYVGTLSHAESGEWFRTYVPLLMTKNDMQGFGSAQTYAERFALKSLVGVATEDDDGNAACAKKEEKTFPQKITAKSASTISSFNLSEDRYNKMLASYKVEKIEDLTEEQAVECISILSKRKPEVVSENA